MTPWRAVLNREGEPLAVLRGPAADWHPAAIPLRPEWEGNLQGLLTEGQALLADGPDCVRRMILGEEQIARRTFDPSPAEDGAWCVVPFWVANRAERHPAMLWWRLGGRLPPVDGHPRRGRPLFLAEGATLLAVVRVLEVQGA